jgi:hypothetical protein
VKTYRIYWLSGAVELIQGLNITDALLRKGYGSGAIMALEFYEEVKK